MIHPPPKSTLFPYTTLFRSYKRSARAGEPFGSSLPPLTTYKSGLPSWFTSRKTASTSSDAASAIKSGRSEEHTSELQSRQYLVCRLLLEKKKNKNNNKHNTT